MSCAFAQQSSPAEVPFFNALLKSTKKPTTPQNISFSSQLNKSKISTRNPSGQLRTRTKAQIMAFYALKTDTTEETMYELLGISESGSLTDLKKAYKQMARKYHPDVSPPDRVDEHTKRFIMVQQAYETLSDPQIRASYDRDLANHGLSDFAFSGKSRPYHYYNQSMEETGEWRMTWNSQIDELKQQSMNSNGRRGKMTWGARMRNQR